MKHFKLAIFDWNGTILNDLPFVFGSVCTIFDRYGVAQPTLQQFRDEIEANFMKFYYAHGIPKEVTADDLNKIRKEYFLAHWNDVSLHDEAREALAKCGKLVSNLAVVSSELYDVLKARLKQFELEKYFSSVRAAYGAKEKLLLETVNEFNCSPEEAFYVDDTYDGISSAKNVGMATFGTVNGYNSSRRVVEASPNFVISSLLLVPETVAFFDGLRTWQNNKELFPALVQRALAIDSSKTIDSIQKNLVFSEDTIRSMASGEWLPDAEKQDVIVKNFIRVFGEKEEEAD